MTTTATREKPVLFSDPMVRAILDGRKTCTRRLVKHQPTRLRGYWGYRGSYLNTTELKEALRADSPWKVGDRLWVRECWMPRALGLPISRVMRPNYRADGDKPEWRGLWKPSIHMPRWASRINLTVTAVDPVQIQDISDQEAFEEGMSGPVPMMVAGEIGEGGPLSPVEDFRETWDLLYPGSWDRNDWVYANEFEIEKST